VFDLVANDLSGGSHSLIPRTASHERSLIVKFLEPIT
jgi:hypothetical protein